MNESNEWEIDDGWTEPAIESGVAPVRSDRRGYGGGTSSMRVS